VVFIEFPPVMTMLAAASIPQHRVRPRNAQRAQTPAPAGVTACGIPIAKARLRRGDRLLYPPSGGAEDVASAFRKFLLDRGNCYPLATDRFHARS
jgi:hypothetical protein